MGKYSETTVFLALHHLKKTETDFAVDALLGASVISDRTDAKIYLEGRVPMMIDGSFTPRNVSSRDTENLLGYSDLVS